MSLLFSVVGARVPQDKQEEHLQEIAFLQAFLKDTALFIPLGLFFLFVTELVVGISFPDKRP